VSWLFPPLLLLLLKANDDAVADASRNYLRQHSQISGPCFQIRGRISVYNGAPALRICAIGSKRLLGISEGRFLLPDYENIPADFGGWPAARMTVGFATKVAIANQ